MSKLNNILSSIALLVGKDVDETLVDVLETQQSQIEKLKSNVKWLYKYGGVGTSGGTGGSGEAVANWKVNASLAGQVLATDKTIMFSEKGSYVLVLNIVKHGGNYYEYTIRQNGNRIYYGSFSNSDNKNYTIEHTITCNDNGNLTIQVKDEEGEQVDISFSYITNMFTPSIKLVNNKNLEITSKEQLMTTYKQQGLYLQFSYKAPVNVKIAYEMVDFDGNIHTLENSDGDTLDVATELTEIFKIPVSANPNIESETYIMTFKYKIYNDNNIIYTNYDNPIKYVISLIPAELFLKVQSSSLTLSKTELTESNDIVGMKSIQITPFEGNRSERTYKCTYSILCYKDNSEISNEITLAERQSSTININCANTGSYKVTLHALDYNNVQSNIDMILYFYITESDVNFEYYPNEMLNNAGTYINYFRGGDAYGNAFLPYRGKSYIEQTISNDEYVFNIDYNPSGSQDVLFQFGIQYNIVNEDTLPILKLESSSENNSGAITVYPNKFFYGPEKNNVYGDIYIPKQEIASASDHTKYHLVTIYKRVVEVDKNSDDNYYEIVVYIDGVLEGSLESFTDLHTKYDKLTLYKGNYYIDFLEATTFNSVDEQDRVITSNRLTDADIVKNFYVYQYFILVNPEAQAKLELLEYLSDEYYSFDINTTLVTVANKDVALTVGKQLDIPTLFLNVNPYGRYTKNNGLDFVTWMQKSYGAEEKFMKDNVENGGSDESNSGTIDTFVVNKLEYLNVGDLGFTTHTLNNTEFIIDIQGTSTRENKTPNLTLALESVLSDSTTVPVFTPNFSLTDKKSFLPETKFYLKADIADSAHSNNTATGKFVNDNTSPFLSGLTGRLSGHIKQCLEGFPVLVYASITTKDPDTEEDITKIYLLGIYNFNLGRGSDYNLGYKDYSVFNDENGDLLLTGGFLMLELTKDDFSKSKDNIVIAEVLEKTAYFDFSQFDEKVLFPISDNDTTCMYGDFVYSDKSTYQDIIQNFTKEISLTGGFIFKQLGKHFGELLKAYHAVDENGNFLNLVPDYTTQYTRDSNDVTKFYAKSAKVVEEYNISNLNLLLEGDNASGISAILDYESLVLYYTICMAFGLVDSVLKNLNIKSWHKNTINGKIQGYFHIAFYDMDTGYGSDNQGDNTSHVAFSDYWYTPDSNGSTVNISDTINNVYRDFYPEHPKEVGYDVPSTYLFGIAKYAKSLNSDLSTSPQELWASWRKSDGCLRNADYFMETYYNSALSNIPEQIFNLNYRAKYFVKETDESNATGTHKFHQKDWKQFKGRKLYKVRDWLNNRFHILDAYFGMHGAEDQAIYKLTYTTEGNKVCTELTETGGLNWVKTDYSIARPTVDTTNSDIKYRVNIFTGSADVNSTAFNSKNVNTELEFSALDYSPLMYKVGSTNGRTFMLNDSLKIYKIPYSVSSSNTSCYFYGSYYLTNIGNITPFIAANDTFQIYSPYVLSLIGETGTIGSFFLNYVPSLKTIRFTSAQYSGTLTLDNSTTLNFPLLSSIDISNTAIALVCNSIPINTLNISNIKSSKVEVIGCNYLNNLIVSNNNTDVIECDLLSITPLYMTNVVLEKQKIKNLTLESKANNSTITITGDETLTELSLTDYETINIIDCVNLTTINITGSKVKNIKILNSKITLLLLHQCENIESVDVTKNTSLTTLILNVNSKNTLSYLNISKTLINILKWAIATENDPVNNSISGTDAYAGMPNAIDLYDATALISSKKENAFICNNNEGVLYIIFPNIGTPGTYLKDNTKNAVRVGTFYGCTKLKRIYGNIIITNGDHTFGGCHKFSIHGDTLDLVAFNERLVIQNLYNDDDPNPIATTVMMPYQLQADSTEVEPKSYYYDGGSEPMDVIFLEGPYRTNMSFDINMFNYTFDSTATTLFDIYYVFSNANPVSSYNSETGTYSKTPLTFYTTFGSFGWVGYYNSGGTKDKFKSYTVSRYMLHNIAQFSSDFCPFDNLTFNYYIPFMSPTMNEDGTVKKDDGWYSPLWNNIKQFPNLGINAVYCVKFLIDKNFFRHTNDNKVYAPLESISGMYLLPSNDTVTISTESIKCDDNKNEYIINKNNYIEYFDVYGKLGDENYGIFTLLRNLKEIKQFRPYLLDFSTITVPDKVETLEHAFRATYAKGILDMNKTFTNKSVLKNIYGSTFSLTVGTAEITFDNNTFSNFSKLVNIGRTMNNSETEIVTDFVFDIDKYVDASNFPYDMFNPENGGCPNSTKIETVNTLFSKLQAKNANDTIVELPGDLFKHMPELNNTYRCFYSLQLNYKLTSDSFINCPKISVVSEMFANQTFNANNRYSNDQYIETYVVKPWFHGNIPYHFLYHGINEEYAENKNIIRMDNLFAGQDIDPYVNENPTSIWDYDGVHGRSLKNDTLYAKAIHTEKVINITDELSITISGKFIDESLVIDETYQIQNSTGYLVYVDDEYAYDDCFKVLWNDDIIMKFTKQDTIITKTFTTVSPYLYSKYDDIHYADTLDTKDNEKIFLEANKYIRTYSNIYSLSNVEATNYSITNYGYFCCPPDLFKYCQNLSGVNVKGVFNNCGSNLNDVRLVTGFTKANRDSTGLTGRIPPYLFMPISNVTNLTNMFTNCKALSYYCANIVYSLDPEDNDIIGYETVNSYLVPKTLFKYTPYVKYLTNMFYGNIFSYSNSFKNVLPNIKGLVTENMFKNCRWTNTQGNTDIDGLNDYDARFILDYPLFKQVPDNINSMFALDIETNSASSSYPYQYMQFGDESSTVNIYGLSVLPSTTPRRVFAGYRTETTIAPAQVVCKRTISVSPSSTEQNVEGDKYAGNWHYITISSGSRYDYLLYNIVR